MVVLKHGNSRLCVRGVGDSERPSHTGVPASGVREAGPRDPQVPRLRLWQLVVPGGPSSLWTDVTVAPPSTGLAPHAVLFICSDCHASPALDTEVSDFHLSSLSNAGVALHRKGRGPLVLRL